MPIVLLPGVCYTLSTSDRVTGWLTSIPTESGGGADGQKTV